MILFLEFFSGGIRGGEVYNERFRSFLARTYAQFEPREKLSYPRSLRNPLRHMFHNLNRVKTTNPELAVLDISSGLRNIPAVRYLKKRGKKILLIVLEQRLALRYKGRLVKWLVFQAEKYLTRNADMILTISQYSANLAREKGVRSDCPIVIAPPGMENIHPDTSSLERRANSTEESFRLLYVGACVWNKGLWYLVDAMGSLRDLNINLDIVGKFDPKSEYYLELARLIKNHGIEDRVTFHGFLEQNDIIDKFRQSSIYVHPSLMEGYGMALVEAMSFGLPIVTTTAGAIPELVKDGVNGLLVPPGDSEGLSESIRSLYADSEKRAKFARNNLEKVTTLPTWDDFEAILISQMVPKIAEIAGISPSLPSDNRPPIK